MISGVSLYGRATMAALPLALMDDHVAAPLRRLDLDAYDPLSPAAGPPHQEIIMAKQSNPVIWFELPVKDIERARRFYESILGTTLTPTMEFAGSTRADREGDLGLHPSVIVGIAEHRRICLPFSGRQAGLSISHIHSRL